jgi:acyl carrier protein
MVPSSFIVIEQWPLSANGKLNKKALPEPELSALQTCYVAPESDLESKLVELWSKVLNLPTQQISTAENFFALGGNSLSVMSLMHQIRTEFAVDVDLAELYKGMDIRQIAQKVVHLQWLQDDDDLDCEELVL